MKDLLRPVAVIMAGVFLFAGFVMPMGAAAQAESFAVMTLADGTTISMTEAQLVALGSQQGVTLLSTSMVLPTQIAIPLPAGLHGGLFLVGEPAALASAMNAVGISSGLTATSFAGATAGAGAISVGAVAGAAMTAGVSAGTIAVGAAAAAAIGGGAAALGSGSGGGGGGGATPTHSTTSHH